MPRVTYSDAQRREAVALARVIGAEAASKQLGIGGKDTVRGWMLAAGDPPELQGSAEGWSRLLDLAQSKAEADLASGKLSAVQAASIAGIAERNLREIAKSKPEQAATSAVVAREGFYDWLVDTLTIPPPDDWPAVESAVDHIQRELLVRANAEPYQPHRTAMLAWFSGNEREAGDILEWAQGQVADLIATHGSLVAWERWRQAIADREATIDARARVLATSGLRTHEAAAMAREISDDLPIPEVVS